MARCWVSEASDAGSALCGVGAVGFLLFDFLIVDASISARTCSCLSPLLLFGAWCSGVWGVGVSVCFVVLIVLVCSKTLIKLCVDYCLVCLIWIIIRAWCLLGVLVVCCGQVVKGAWWMPWHREPMKDVGACEMPWGVGNRALIRGCPNGGTQ